MHGSGLKEVWIIYREGRENVIADALSKYPHGPAAAEGIAESKTQIASVIGLTAKVGNSDVSDLLQMEPVPDLSSQLPTLPTEQGKYTRLLYTSNHLLRARIAGQSNAITENCSTGNTIHGLLYFLDPKRQHKKRSVIPVHLR